MGWWRPACSKNRRRDTAGCIVDYAALFNVTLDDYVEATGDVETGRDLWPAAKRQLEIIGRDINAEGLYIDPKNMWIFIDWSDKLDRNAAIQCVLVYAYRKTLALARRIGRESEVAEYAARIERMVAAARKHYWDASKRVFVSGPNRQVSWGSQAWMAISGVSSRARVPMPCAPRSRIRMRSGPSLLICTTTWSRECWREGSKRGSFAARIVLGRHDRCGRRHLLGIYDPAQPLRSPYGDIHINSYCHAWSCTPSYLLRSGLVKFLLGCYGLTRPRDSCSR